EHRDMAEDVVEDVGFLHIVKLLGRADEIACRKAPVGEMIEKDIVGYEARHCDDLPTRRRHQARIELAIIRNAGLFELEHVDTAQKGFRGTAGKHRRLARKKAVPHRMLGGGERLPVLRNRPVGRGARRRRVVDMGVGIRHAQRATIKLVSSETLSRSQPSSAITLVASRSTSSRSWLT